MKTKKIKNLVKKAKAELNWLVLELPQDKGPVRIVSDPDAKVHRIFLPPEAAEADPTQELLYLHELGHATLCERVHPFFGTMFPITGVEERLVPAVSPLINAAGDWFVGQWQTEFCPELALAELKKEFDTTSEQLSNQQTSSVEVDKFFVAALIIAQSLKYLKVQNNSAGFLDKVVQAFLDVPPENPTVQKLEQLINKFLALGAPLRCRKVTIEGRDLLEFYPRAGSEGT